MMKCFYNLLLLLVSFECYYSSSVLPRLDLVQGERYFILFISEIDTGEVYKFHLVK
jgi:hypothetical protein